MFWNKKDKNRVDYFDKIIEEENEPKKVMKETPLVMQEKKSDVRYRTKLEKINKEIAIEKEKYRKTSELSKAKAELAEIKRKKFQESPLNKGMLQTGEKLKKFGKGYASWQDQAQKKANSPQYNPFGAVSNFAGQPPKRGKKQQNPFDGWF